MKRNQSKNQSIEKNKQANKTKYQNATILIVKELNSKHLAVTLF